MAKPSKKAGHLAYYKPMNQPGHTIEIKVLNDIYQLLKAESLDHLALELEDLDLIIWVAATGNISPSNLNFTTRTHTYGSFTGMEAYGFPIYGNALIQKTDSNSGNPASLTDKEIRFVKDMIGELDLNPLRYYRNPDPFDPEKLDETASSMAWTLNDELWETTPEHRKKAWREIARETARSLMLPPEPRKLVLDKISQQIQLLQGL